MDGSFFPSNSCLIQNNFFCEDDARLNNRTSFDISPRFLPILSKYLNNKESKALSLSCCSLYNKIAANSLGQLKYICMDIFKKIATMEGVLNKLPFLNKEYNKLVYNVKGLRKEFVDLFQKQIFSKLESLIPNYIEHCCTLDGFEHFQEIFRVIYNIDLSHTENLIASIKIPYFNALAWLAVGKKNHELLKKIPPLINDIDPICRVEILSSLAQEIAAFNIEQAWDIADSMRILDPEEADKVFVEIIKIEAKENIDEAIARISDITSPSNRKKAWLEMIAVTAKADYEKAINLAQDNLMPDEFEEALHLIIRVLLEGPEINIVQAHALAEPLNPDNKSRMLCLIAQKEALIDINLAEKTIKSITIPIFKAEAFFSLAKINSKYLINVHEALEASRHSFLKDSIILKLVTFEAQLYGNLKEPFKTLAKYVPHHSHSYYHEKTAKDRVYEEIIAIKAKKNSENAFKLLPLITDNFWQTEACIEIFKAKTQIKSLNFKICRYIILKVWNSSLKICKLRFLYKCLEEFHNVK